MNKTLGQAVRFTSEGEAPESHQPRIPLFMIFNIQHTSEYRYSQPVFLEPHIVRLCPRGTGAQRVLRINLEVDPEPAGLAYGLDQHGNSYAYTWFNGKTDHLTVHADLTVRTFRENPYDFYFDPEANRLPMRYAGKAGVGVASALAYYLTEPDEKLDADACALVDELVAESGGLAPEFLSQLCLKLNQTIETVHRETGLPWTANETWSKRQGACRDQTILFMAMCQRVGIAARFVTGYQEGDPDPDQRELHAWAEAYLPGIGWRGYDPTLGIAVADRHVTLCAARDPQDAATITGNFRGTGARSDLSAHIIMRIEDDPPGIDKSTSQMNEV